jgi:hypothetical protein
MTEISAAETSPRPPKLGIPATIARKATFIGSACLAEPRPGYVSISSPSSSRIASATRSRIARASVETTFVVLSYFLALKMRVCFRFGTRGAEKRGSGNGQPVVARWAPRCRLPIEPMLLATYLVFDEFIPLIVKTRGTCSRIVLGAIDGPSQAGRLHPVFEKVAAGSLGDPLPIGITSLEVLIVGHVASIVLEVRAGLGERAFEAESLKRVLENVGEMPSRQPEFLTERNRSRA